MNEQTLIDSLRQQERLRFSDNIQQSDIIAIGQKIARIHDLGKANAFLYFELISWNDLDDKGIIQLPYLLMGFFSSVKAPAEKIDKLSRSLVEKAPQRIHHILILAFNEWVEAADPYKLQQLTRLLESNDADSPLVASLLSSLCNYDQKLAIATAIKFVGDERPMIKRDAILALGNFEFINSKTQMNIEECLIETAHSKSEEYQCYAIRSIQNLLKKAKSDVTNLFTCLANLAVNPTSEVRHTLIENFFELRSLYPHQLRGLIIDLMKTVPKNCPDSIDLVDYMLYQMNLDTDRELIFEILSGLLSQQVEPPNFDDFEPTVAKIFSSSDQTLGWFLTKWLLEGNSQICHQLTMLFPPDCKKLYKFELEEFMLSAKEIFNLSKKIFSYFILCRGTAISLLCECLRNLKLDDRKRLEAEIVAFWFRNYRDDIKIFEAIVSAYPYRGYRASINRLKQHLDVYIKPIRSSAFNLAFSSSRLEQSVQAELNKQFSEEITQEVKNKSVFLSTIPSKLILYGRSCVTFTQSSEHEPSAKNTIKLQNFSTQFVIPAMDVLCPNYLSYIRKYFSIVKH